MNIIVLILVMLITAFFAIKPISVRKFNVPFFAPTLFLLGLLYLGKIVSDDAIFQGIVGEGQVRPWEIIIIFFSVAFVSISVDVTGIFDYLAYKIVNFAKGNGFRLFIFFYIFAGILTLFTSNDIVILTLTPIIFYIGRHANINILPYLFVQFFGANTLSMFLYIGNPTNIIIGNALGFGFLRYTQIMWLPTFVATLANFILLFIIFRKQITRHYTINEQSKVTNHNPFFTSISLAGLALMLLSLAISQNMHWDIWEVTLFFAILFFFLHLFRLLFYPSKQSILGLTIHRMPWKILPFITVFFIYVQSLLQYGFVDNLAEISSHFSKNLFSGIFINGFSGIILANIINNQPMTILFSSVFVSKSFCVAENVFLGSAYAVIIASNLAANITLMGALAGMMWKKILGDKGLCISYWDFLKKGLLITPLVFFLTLLTLYFVLI